MSNSPVPIQCANPTCLHPANVVGQTLCDRCQVPLVYRYLWAVGQGAAQIPADTLVADRYLVKSPQIWLDTQPGMLAMVPTPLPDALLPYLHLYPERLHIPELYGLCDTEAGAIVLLDNVPIDAAGQPFAALDTAWTTVPPSRQVYWLWQLLHLWSPLKQQGVAMSLLIPENVRVEGWRVRLQELLPDWQSGGLQPLQSDAAIDPVTPTQPPTLPPGLADAISESPSSSVALSEFVAVWMPLIETAHESVRERLRSVLQALQTADAAGDATALKAGITDLNQLLLQQVAQLPLTIDVAGATTTGPQRTHNEDACYPSLQDLYQRRAEAEDFLLPYLGIICDGIGGHEGGEVASQRALEDLKTLTRNLLNEFLSQPELLLPETVSQQLESVVRVVNNVIANQNDEQGRELRQRMGTTLVMALQLPQQVDTARGKQNAHELYLVTVGDSRAYWLTPRYCHRLTVDDDVATREVRMGRSVYQTALERPDGGALTQAIGTRDAEALNPTVQRFVIEESGLLLLCSDGLSDNDRVEQNWEDVTRQVFKGRLSLEDAVQTWLGIANEQNGHDNTSVVLMRFQVGEAIKLVQPEVQAPPPASPVPVPDELTEASRALLYDEESDPDVTEASPAPAREPIATSTSNKQPASLWIWLALLGLVACFAGIIGVIWYNSQQTQPIPQTAPQQTPQQTP